MAILDRYRLSSGPLSRGEIARSVPILAMTTIPFACMITWPAKAVLPVESFHLVADVVWNLWLLVLMLGMRALARRRLIALGASLIHADLFLAATMFALVLSHLGVLPPKAALDVQFLQLLLLLRREPGKRVVT